MAIDPMLYRKISGRTGDPNSRLGEALARSAKSKTRVKADRDRGFSERLVIGHLKTQWLISVIGGLIVLAFIFWSAI